MDNNLKEVAQAINKYKWLNAHPELNLCMTCEQAALQLCNCAREQDKNLPPYLEQSKAIDGVDRLMPNRPGWPGRFGTNFDYKSLDDSKGDEIALLLNMPHNYAIYKTLLCRCAGAERYMSAPMQVCAGYKKNQEAESVFRNVFSLSEIRVEYERRYFEALKERDEWEKEQERERQAEALKKDNDPVAEFFSDYPEREEEAQASY